MLQHKTEMADMVETTAQVAQQLASDLWSGEGQAVASHGRSKASFSSHRLFGFYPFILRLMGFTIDLAKVSTCAMINVVIRQLPASTLYNWPDSCSLSHERMVGYLRRYSQHLNRANQRLSIFLFYFIYHLSILSSFYTQTKSSLSLLTSPAGVVVHSTLFTFHFLLPNPNH